MADYDYLDKGNSDGTILGQVSTAKIGFWGVTPCDQPAALTTGLTTITYVTASGTPQTTITAAVTGGARFTTTEEAQCFLQVVANIQTRLAEIQTNMAECGLIAGGTATAETDKQYDFVGWGTDDGSILGKASTDPVGLWGITPCDQSTALTVGITAIVCTATVSVLDYTIAALVTGSTAYGFVDEAFASLFRVVSNLQARIAQVSTNLAEVGAIAGGTAVVSTTSGSAKYDYLDKGNDDGTIFGKTSSVKLGFWGATPVAQQSAFTTAATTITCTAAASTADYAMAATIVTADGFGFVTLTAAQTLLYVVQNAQTRMAEAEAALENIGLVAAN